LFTGIIETIGSIRCVTRGNKSATIGIVLSTKDFPVAIGGSVACDGVCLTLESVADNVVYFTAVAETLERTTLGKKRIGDKVNIERALAVNGRLDGHFVLGHVDAVGTIVADRTVGDSTVRSIRFPKELARYFAEKGSVAIDGISLTIAAVASDVLDVSLIPFTFKETTMAAKHFGELVNLECDVIARYLERLITFRGTSPAEGAGPNGSSLFDKMERLGF